MSRTSLAALGIFVANTLIAGVLLWQARPRTVATMDTTSLSTDEYAILLKLIEAEGVVPSQVRVCAEKPCTRGPAVFIEAGQVQRLELPRSSTPGPLSGERL
jgi:hypothetical protein